MTLVQWLQIGWACVLLPMFGGSCIGASGCSVLTTGPGVVKDVSDISKTVAMASWENRYVFSTIFFASYKKGRSLTCFIFTCFVEYGSKDHIE